MNSSEEKLNKWVSKALRGEKGFQLFSHGKDGCSFQDEDRRDKVTSFVGGIWDDDQIYVCRKFDEKTSIDSDEQLFCVIKDETKLIVAIQNVGIFSFGLKDGDTENCRAFFLVQCGWFITLITATNDPSMVLVRSYVHDGQDPLSAILPELFDHLAGNYLKKEVAANARETRPSDSADLGTDTATGATTQA